MLNKANSEHEMHHVGNYEEFSHDTVFCLIMKMKIVRNQLNRMLGNLLLGLQIYFMQEGNEGSPISALEISTDFVHLQ
jgi:hypothetical protein